MTPERSFVIVNTEAIKRGHLGIVIQIFEKKGF